MNSLCKIRDLYRAIIAFENEMIADSQLSLNEGMLLCCLATHGSITSTQIAEHLQLTCSNTSKVIKSVENKGLIARHLGDEDKRTMFFTLTVEGKEKLNNIKCSNIELPDVLAQAIK